MMQAISDRRGTLSDVERTLVRLAAIIAVGDEPATRAAFIRAIADAVPPAWVEEVVLQTYMFAGFPRALNAMREWRRLSGIRAPDHDPELDRADTGERGATTCEHVYGRFYTNLRRNVATLHPALDRWMVDTGYGQVLGRPALDLARRELCIVAICAAAGYPRQLQSHLHGALHVGVDPDHIADVLATVADLTPGMGSDAHRLWMHVRESATASA